MKTEAVHIPIVIIDFGSQYTQLIARRIREIGVYCEILPFDVEQNTLQLISPKGIILSGGPDTVTNHTTPRIPEIIFELSCPIFGICYGMQAMAAQLGGKVHVSSLREFGFAQVAIKNKTKLFSGIEDSVNDEGDSLLEVWMSHGDSVSALPKDFVIAGYTTTTPIAAMAHQTKDWYGVQFHPEVTHTAQGERLLSRFVLEICGCENNWRPKHIIANAIKNIRQEVGTARVLLALSGGVDSAVTAALLHQAIGDQLVCVFVDHGLLRLGDAEQVMTIFNKQQGIRVIKVNAAKRFLLALKGVTDPEQKRKIIGEEFIRIFEEEAQKLDHIVYLAQGTIYPDVVESAATRFGKAVVIKSHHNVGGLPERMSLRLIEPLRELFKDEVRKIGLELGLPRDLISRQPFPGPGLAVRILGEIKEEYIHILQRADAIFLEELKKASWYEKISQAFVVFLPVKAVGVKGDARHYEYVVALRAVETTDFMTAHWTHLPYQVLAEVSRRLTNEISGIARVTYDISSKPPATIEWE